MKMTTNNIPQGYKDSPLGIIPEEWEIKKLGEVCTFIKSGKNKEKSNEGLFHVFGSTGIIGFTNKYVYNCPLLLIARVGANAGFIYYINEKCDVSDNTLILRLNSSYDFIFAYNQLKQYNLNRLIFGSGQPLITASLLKNIKISFPPLPEQQKIAEVLSTWDKAIEKQSQLIEKLELRKKGLMQQLLTGKKRLPGFSSKWKTIKLGDISKRIVRRNINEQCTNVVTISAQKGFIRQTDFFNKKVASETIENYYLVKRNEFCYNKSYSNGFPMGAIKRLKEFDQAVVTTLYICFAVQEERISVDFIEQYFSLGLLNRGLMKIANEGGRAHGLLNVTPNDFFNINLNLPPIDEQKAISSILFNAYNEVVLAKNKIKSLQEQKKGLMQVLLTGKKRIIQ